MLLVWFVSRRNHIPKANTVVFAIATGVPAAMTDSAWLPSDSQPQAKERAPTMKPRTYSLGWSVLSLLAAAAIPGRAAPFSADLADTRGGQTAIGTLRYQDKSYRWDFSDQGQQLVIMVDGQSGTMRLLHPSEKAYYEAGPSEPMSLFANPFSAYAFYAKTKEVRTEGAESVGGVTCKKQVVSGGGQVFVTAWVSDEFDLPLRVQTQLDGRTIELQNIKRGPQDPGLFVLPADYHLTVVKEEPEPQPEWAGQVAGAPVLAVPFEKTLTEGGIVRMRPQVNRWISVTGTTAGQGQGTFTLAPFKGGKYLGGGSMSSFTVDPKDSGTMTDGTGPDAADEIIVRVGQGTMTIKTAFVAPQRRGQGAAPAAAEPSSPQPVAEATAAVNGPASADIAAPLEISWTGPANKDDFISIALPAQPPGSFFNRAFVRNGNPAKVWAPSDPGEYEVRYMLGRGTKLLAKAPITVNAVTAKVEPPASVKAGMEFEVVWQGPGHAEDFISVARPGQPPGAVVSSTRVRPGGTLKLRAPREPGTYEVRYILGRGSRLLAKAVIAVTAPER